MSARWLLKSDPEEYSFADLVRDGPLSGMASPITWRSNTCVTSERGVIALIYHTGTERAAVGIAEVLTDPYSDPKENGPLLMVIELGAREKLPRPVGFDEIKKHASLKNFDLVRLPRLSVMPVSEAQWNAILAQRKK